jgi:hypothetical protein
MLFNNKLSFIICGGIKMEDKEIENKKFQLPIILQNVPRWLAAYTFNSTISLGLLKTS